MSGLELGIIGGAISGLATTLGALPILSRNKKIISLLETINMDFIIGVMLSASAFSLIVPAFEKSKSLHTLFLALLLGAVFIRAVGYILEKTQLTNMAVKKNKQSLLFILAMMAHNLPEGMASGASMTVENNHQGYSLLSAIAFQNIPEGLTTALSFISLGLNPWWAFMGNFLTGFIELIGGMIGGHLSASMVGVLPLIMAFAGGAMMSLTLIELAARIKESSITFFIRPGFLSGAVLMMGLSSL